ncbi:hypothetical protein [Pedobacter mendelii]|uniref:Uncharacterized protein n=1 Tax=Pedobacter mendelii TaxID=1908240 RepID=A0ABQ2BJZ5_9SPHI|nr:hypothetical protein [Pedobacter mendelii]GGI27941.1 hypothetical protein GCM10008119_30170 [Pedobacter mendelii]
MKNKYIPILLITVFAVSCSKKTDKDRAIDLVESKYESSTQKLDFDDSTLDSIYNISPKAYSDSLKKGNDLDSVLSVLEGEIEHLEQKESDSVGKISASLTKERYRLLDLEKTKPKFVGWKLVGVKIRGEKAETLSFNFDKAIGKITP